jgi:hypothetical protein
MITGCYILHLYCDTCTAHNSRPTGKCVPDEYTAETGQQCRQRARKQGWRLNLKKGTATCPACSKGLTRDVG